MENNKMKCNIKSKELSLYVDGRYSGDKRFLEEHIAECAKCKEQIESLKFLKNSLKGLPAVSESPGFDIEFNRLLDKRLKKKRKAIFEIPGRIKEAAANIKDLFISPVPVFVRVAASFILIITVFLGIRAQGENKIPFVEFTAGEVKICHPAQKEWIDADIGMRLKSGDKIQLTEGAMLNIASKNRYKMRLKDESLVVVAKLDSRLRAIDTDLNVSYGKVLVNTTDGFKGSKMNLYTPSCDAEVVGTAFMLDVFKDKTWLGVLEGKVKVLSRKEKKAFVYVSSGQKTAISSYSYPSVPELFSEKEWRMAQELYQLVETPKIMLLIGTGSDRIDELLETAPLYVPDISQKIMPKQLQKAIDALAQARKNEDPSLVKEAAGNLESILMKHPGLEYNIELLMFVASQYHYVSSYEDAIRVFRDVIKKHPGSSFASLAQCGIATIYQKNLNDIDTAEKAFHELVKSYPNSVDAIRAKESLMSLR